MKKVVVIGGTGLIGSKVVARLAEQGHEAVAASPNSGVKDAAEAYRSGDPLVYDLKEVATRVEGAMA